MEYYNADKDDGFKKVSSINKVREVAGVPTIVVLLVFISFRIR